jgi:hypothetical protein
MLSSHLGRLTGTGQLFSGIIEIATVRYEIDVFQEGHTTTGQGVIHGDLPAAAPGLEAMCRLVLSSGKSVQVFLTPAIPIFEYAHISTSGPIPGFWLH